MSITRRDFIRYSTLTAAALATGTLGKDALAAEENAKAGNHHEWTVTQYNDESGRQGMFYTIQRKIDGQMIVIDGGNKENTEQVRNVIVNGGGHVAHWFLTHYHGDHVDAFNEIFADPQGINIDNIYAAPLDPDVFAQVKKYWDTPESFTKFREITKGRENIHFLKRNQTLNIDDLRIDVLNAYDDIVYQYGRGDIPNNCSLMLKISGKMKSMLFCGDTHTDSLGAYLVQAYGKQLHADYVQTGHHGNASFPYSFYEVVAPTVALFDAPEWLMTGEKYTASILKAQFAQDNVKVYDFTTAPNRLKLS